MKKLAVNKETPILQPLYRLIERQNHQTLVLWTLDCAFRMVDLFESRHQADPRPREAVAAAKAWAAGEIKMPMAKHAALASHQAATEVQAGDPAGCAAARACGHIVGTVHAKTHAPGLVIYGITAMIAAHPLEDPDLIIQREIDYLTERLLDWEKNWNRTSRPWADFMQRND